MKLLSWSPDSLRLKILFALIALLVAAQAPAKTIKLDSLTRCGHTFTNVTVLVFNTTHAWLMYEGGSASVKLRELDTPTQKLLGYDAAAAAEAEKQQAADDARYMQAVESNIVAKARQAALAARKAAATSEDSLADPVSKSSLIGKPSPALDGGKWLGEKPALAGKLVLVAFWEPWSIPCRKYLPTLAGLQNKFAGKLAVVGVTSETETEIAEMTGPKVEFASLLDPELKLGATVGVNSIPYVMLVDPQGVVRYQGHPTAITEKQVEAILAKAEAE